MIHPLYRKFITFLYKELDKAGLGGSVFLVDLAVVLFMKKAHVSDLLFNHPAFFIDASPEKQAATQILSLFAP